MNPPISVIIPVFNGAATVADTLAALLAQTGVRDAMEVLVVDNNSTDNTVEIVRRFPVTLLREMRPGPSMCATRAFPRCAGRSSSAWMPTRCRPDGGWRSCSSRWTIRRF